MIETELLRKCIAANVTRLRNERGWSQTELAEKLGVSFVHVNRIERAKASPGPELLFAIADVFGVSTDALRQVAEKISAA